MSNSSDQKTLQIIQKRLVKRKALENNPHTRDTVLLTCKQDIFFWLKSFAFTYDPRPETLKNIPFTPYDYQETLIQNLINSIQKGEDILIEKSRDMGVTWCVIYVFQWFWQFHTGFSFHMGSKKQDNVDILGDPSSLFGKLRYNIALQPQLLLPEGFSLNKHSSYLKIINPHTGNTITGESSNPEFSRSGRYSAILFDEFAFWPYDVQAWSAAGDSTTCRIAVSTPYGKFNKFADIRFNSSIKVETIHWKQHPHKTQDWYESQKRRRTKDEIARELDINYLLSIEGRVYKDFDHSLHLSTTLKPDPTLPIIRAWDFGLNPAVVFSQIDKKGKWTIIDEIVPPEDLKPTISEFIPQVIDRCKKNYENYDFKDVCDIAGKQRSSHTGKTDIDWLISFGIKPLYNYVKIEEGINLVASRLICKDFSPQPALQISNKCYKVLEAFAGAYRRKKPAAPGAETPPTQEHPYEDVMDCIRYTAWQYFDSHTGKKPKRRKRTYTADNRLTGY
jgi:hypothetical protein